MRIFGMRLFCVTVISAVILFSASCQGAGPAGTRQGSAAQSVQDVIDAWNLYCASCNFDTLVSSSSVEVGSLYSGPDFESDGDQLMLLMQIELHSAERPGVVEDELISALLNDPAWF